MGERASLENEARLFLVRVAQRLDCSPVHTADVRQRGTTHSRFTEASSQTADSSHAWTLHAYETWSDKRIQTQQHPSLTLKTRNETLRYNVLRYNVLRYNVLRFKVFPLRNQKTNSPILSIPSI